MDGTIVLVDYIVGINAGIKADDNAHTTKAIIPIAPNDRDF